MAIRVAGTSWTTGVHGGRSGVLVETSPSVAIVGRDVEIGMASAALGATANGIEATGDDTVVASDATSATSATGAEVATATIASLRDALHRRSVMLDSLTEGLILMGPDGVIVEWNRAAETILGLSGEQLAGRSPIDPAWSPIRDNGLPWPSDEHPIVAALTSGEPVPEQTMGIELPSGDLIWLKVNARPVRDAGGAVIGAVAAFRDVTAAVELQRRSNAMAHQLRIAIESGAIGTALIDLDGRLTFANSAFADLVGSSESLVGSLLSDLVAGDRRVSEAFDGPIGSSGVVIEDVPLQVIGSDTEQRWVRLHLSRLPDMRSGSAMLVQASDSTALRSAMVELARNEELARVCLDAIDQGVVFVSETEGVLRTNASLSRMLGYGPAEFVDAWATRGWMLYDEHAEPIRSHEFFGLRAVETGEAVRDVIVWVRHRDGHWLRTSCSAFPFGWTDEMVIVVADVDDATPADAPRPPS